MADIKYYVTGNTAQGFVNVLETNLAGIETIIVLSHPSAAFKTKIMCSYMNHYDKDNWEILESSISSDYLEGVINRQKSYALIDARITNRKNNLINLENIYSVNQHDVSEITQLMHQAYESYAEGLRIHDQLEDIYIEQLDIARADKFAEEFIQDLLKGVSVKNQTSHVFKRLFGTNTAEGSVNVVPSLIQNISNVYYVKGRAGTGKSVLMKKVAKACEDYGLDVEMYYCSFDPDSVDMILVRELDFCMFDSTPPHEFFPVKETDTIIDLYEKLVMPGTDEKFAADIENIQKEYKTHVKTGAHYIQKAGNMRKDIEDQYLNNITKDMIEEGVEEINNLLYHNDKLDKN